MNVPGNLRYTEDHEWVLVKNGIATVGITDYAQSELGDIVFVELPEEESETAQGEPFGTIEAVKAVSDLIAPISGEVIEVNASLDDEPEAVNSDPYGAGWMIKVKMSDESEVDNLLSPESYSEMIDK
ncbi:MAG: glycine cleavage system protein GcvH [Deferribacteres bacterium]|nr:glycine cleavage system protein GcvH [candidate division KSB1 bacterium]MCB9501538.1 glycine cleavage system protein GcvH [Deferribacteres bacterium]